MLATYSYGAFTLCGTPFQGISDQLLTIPNGGPTTPHLPTPRGGGFGLPYSPFPRRYSGNPIWFLFLRVLRRFTSPRSPPLRRLAQEGWEVPFGDPGFKACMRLPQAYRSLPRPSSPIRAQPST